MHFRIKINKTFQFSLVKWRVIKMFTEQKMPFQCFALIVTTIQFHEININFQLQPVNVTVTWNINTGVAQFNDSGTDLFHLNLNQILRGYLPEKKSKL